VLEPERAEGFAGQPMNADGRPATKLAFVSPRLFSACPFSVNCRIVWPPEFAPVLPNVADRDERLAA